MFTPPEYETDIEVAEVARQAQRLYALADSLVARAERIRDSAGKLVSSARVDLTRAPLRQN
jgi:hypothetical protein